MSLLNHSLTLLLTLLLTLPLIGLAQPLTFEKSGFKINALEAPPHVQGSQPLAMLLPSDQGFSANVNVQIQPFNGDILEYRALSQSQFEQLGLKIVSESIKQNEVTLEYSGDMHGRVLHWYSKAIKQGPYVYLATATSLEINWPQNRYELVQAVDSLELTQ